MNRLKMLIITILSIMSTLHCTNKPSAGSLLCLPLEQAGLKREKNSRVRAIKRKKNKAHHAEWKKVAKLYYIRNKRKIDKDLIPLAEKILYNGARMKYEMRCDDCNKFFSSKIDKKIIEKFKFHYIEHAALPDELNALQKLFTYKPHTIIDQPKIFQADFSALAAPHNSVYFDEVYDFIIQGF